MHSASREDIAADYAKMSRISGYLTAELRTTLEPVLAKLAPPAPATPTTKHPSSTRNPMRMRSAAITARPHNATTTHSWPACAG
jgi:hypothetical protein